MATAKIKSGENVVNGSSVVLNGDSSTARAPADRVQSWSSVAGLETLQVLDGRFRAGTWAEERDTDPALPGDYAVAPSGFDATVYLPASGYCQHTLFGVAYGYKVAPASGALEIQSPSGTVVFSEPITAAGAGSFPWEEGFRGVRGRDVLVSLKGGGSDGEKKLTLLGRRVE